MRRCSTVLALALLYGCSGKGGGTDDADTSTDAIVDDGAEAALVTIAPPAPVQPPQMTPCPEGWREVTDAASGITTCDPWPAGGPGTCLLGEAHFPGEPGCRTVGPPCPTSDVWPEDLPTDVPIIYVRSSATGGAGTRDDPMRTIWEAIAAATPGTVIALARGTYHECLLMEEGITLWGACASQTVIACSIPMEDGPGSIAIASPGTAVKNVTVQGQRPGIWVEGGIASVDIDSVLILGVRTAGVVGILGAHVTARDLVIRDVTAKLVADPATSVTLTDVVVRETRHNLDDDGGWGISVFDAAHLTLQRSVVENNLRVGIACEAGASVEMYDSLVQDTQAEVSSQGYGQGISMETGCDLTMQRCVLDTNRTASLVFDASTGTISDVVVRGTLPEQLTGMWGRGINLNPGSDARITRARLHDNTDIGLLVGDSTATLTDIHVTDTKPRAADDQFGQGINIALGASATLERILIENCSNLGLVAIDAEATVTDLEISGTSLPQPFAWQSVALLAVTGGTLNVTRALIHDNSELGVAFGASSTGTLTDIVIRDTASRESDGWWGRGLVIQDGSTVIMRGALLERNHEISIFVVEPGSSLDAAGIAVLDTLRRDCSATTCADTAGGIGVGSYGGAHVDMSDFWVHGHALCGIQLATGEGYLDAGIMELHDGEVAYNPIGVNNQNESLDIDLLMDGVSYFGNDRNLDASYLPVPGLGTIFEI
jgi:hypothetical protein